MIRAFDIVEAEQRSPAWFQARCGRLTGSVAKHMLAVVKVGEAAAKRDLRIRLATERLTQLPQDDGGGYANAAMQRGTDVEPTARGAYEAQTGLLVRQTGFLAHRELLAGCSLDGHVGDFSGIVEIKCPKSATHAGWLREGKVPGEHLPQIRHNLWISGADWCDFVSFDDRFPPPLQLLVVRVQAADANLLGYDALARAFLAEVDLEYQAFLGWRGVA